MRIFTTSLEDRTFFEFLSFNGSSVENTVLPAFCQTRLGNRYDACKGNDVVFPLKVRWPQCTDYFLIQMFSSVKGLFRVKGL